MNVKVDLAEMAVNVMTKSMTFIATVCRDTQGKHARSTLTNAHLILARMTDSARMKLTGIDVFVNRDSQEPNVKLI